MLAFRVFFCHQFYLFLLFKIAGFSRVLFEQLSRNVPHQPCTSPDVAAFARADLGTTQYCTCFSVLPLCKHFSSSTGLGPLTENRLFINPRSPSPAGGHQGCLARVRGGAGTRATPVTGEEKGTMPRGPWLGFLVRTLQWREQVAMNDTVINL